VVIKITRIDFKPGLKGSTLVGKNKNGIEMRFLLKPDTVIHRINPPSNETLEGIVRRTSLLPFQIDEDILVSWKIDTSNYQSTAVSITTLE